MNREMLKECIADAKTIRETAIASAKVALEEAFTPQLTAMFAERLNELELEEAETEKEPTDEMYSNEEKKEENLEEDFNLEELLAELSMEEEQEPTMEGEDTEDEPLEENLMLEDMSDEEIEELVMQVIDDMIASGKLMPGEGEEEDMEDMEDMGDEEEVEDEEIDIDEILSEADSEEVKEEMVNEGAAMELFQAILDQFSSAKEFFQGLYDIIQQGGDPEVYMMEKGQNPTVLAGIGSALGFGVLLAKVFGKSAVDKLKAFYQKYGKGAKSTTEATNEEMEETINELRKELNEVNLLNAKLLYTNKIFKAKNLTESEKIKVLNTFDKAETVKEVKLVFETLTESFKATTAKKNPIKESLGSASKTISTATPKQPIIEVNSAFARMQQLAGLRK
jgi:hypothetical protein